MNEGASKEGGHEDPTPTEPIVVHYTLSDADMQANLGMDHASFTWEKLDPPKDPNSKEAAPATSQSAWNVLALLRQGGAKFMALLRTPKGKRPRQRRTPVQSATAAHVSLIGRSAEVENRDAAERQQLIDKEVIHDEAARVNADTPAQYDDPPPSDSGLRLYP